LSSLTSLTSHPKPSIIPLQSASSQGVMTTTQPSIQIQPITGSTASLIANPLKRKHDDDDYDNI